MDLLWDQKFWSSQFTNYTLIQEGSVTIFLTEDSLCLKSGFIGPFGGPTPLKFEIPREHSSQVKILLSNFEELGRKNGKQHLKIRLPPKGFYQSNDAFLEDLLISLGWVVHVTDVNSSRKLDNKEIESLNRNRLRDFKNWSKLNYEYKTNDEDTIGIYKCIEKNRLEKGLTPGISLMLLERLIDKISPNISTHLIRVNNEIVSCAVALHLNDEIFHVYMWAAQKHTAYLNSSPIALLYVELSKFANERNFNHICLGTSSQEGIVDSGLVRFKDSLGTSISPRLTFRKDLNV